MSYLDKTLLNQFKSTINSTNIFYKSDRLKQKYNLICVVLERLESAVNYLNSHSEFPNSEEDFICFLVYACMIKDGILKLLESVFNKKPDFILQKKYFKDVKLYSKNAFTEETCPTDNAFFEYLRSMAFAHPFETSKEKRPRPFMEDGETHYCPWVIARNDYGVGIRIYTSSDKFIIRDFTFDFNALKEYVKFLYNYLPTLNTWAKDEIIMQDRVWLQSKIDRTGTPNDILKQIKKVYTERFFDTTDIEVIEEFLTCKTTNPCNAEIIRKYRLEIISTIHQICSALDNGDYEKLSRVTNNISRRPKNAHPLMAYQMEKIFCYLDEDHDCFDVEWGRKQAEHFAKEFARKWVEIDAKNMSYSEIKLLVTIACYYESREQEAQ